MRKLPMIQGAGGGKKKTPVESPNTLRSNTLGKLLDLIAYGPIKGLVGSENGQPNLKSVFLDDTPIQNSDGSFNFDGIKLETREGTPDQSVISGFEASSFPVEINSNLLYGLPITRALSDPNTTRVRITIKINSLYQRNDDPGDTFEYQVPFAVTIYREGRVVTSRSYNIVGKCMSAFERTYSIEIPPGGDYGDLVTVEVRRTNQESTKQKIGDAIGWARMEEVVDVKHNYPGCALVGVQVDARLFGDQIPSRKYLVDLSIIQVPSNYNPETRVYSGFWDGQFKYAWTDNPAWAFYDMATNPEIGAGLGSVNRYELYEIAKYCDELVPDGYGGMEPRFTCNTIFSDQENAILALGTLASIFRGMTYWNSDTVNVVADRPGPIRRQITNADVTEGVFEYSGSSLDNRPTVAIVTWNDPQMMYEPQEEVVELPQYIQEYGYREVDLRAVACTSRGQARRMGLWALYSAHEEKQSVSFETAFKNADLRPGDVVEIVDIYRAGFRAGGLVKEIDGVEFTLDFVPKELAEASSLAGWKLQVMQNDKGISEADIVKVEGDTITLLRTLPLAFVGATYVLVNPAMAARLFRIQSVSETDNFTYTVTAIEHSEDKYDFIEYDIPLPDRPTTILPSGDLPAPTELTVVPDTTVIGGTNHIEASIAWIVPQDPRASQFALEGRGPNAFAFDTLYIGDANSVTVPCKDAGQWEYRVRSVSTEWGQSPWTTKSVFIPDLLQPVPPTEVKLIPKTFNVSIRVLRDDKFYYDYEYYRSDVPLALEDVEDNAMYLGSGSGAFEDNTVTYNTEYFYYVRAFNAYGKSVFVPRQTKTHADSEDVLESIFANTQEGYYGKWLNNEVDKISGYGEGSVNERIKDATKITEYDPDTLYKAGARVVFNGIMYVAIQDVPLGVYPTDENYWESMGDVAVIGPGLLQKIEELTQDVEEMDGVLTVYQENMDSLRATLRPERADGEKADAIDGWRTQAAITEVRRVAVSELQALAQIVQVLEVELGDTSANLTNLSETVATNEQATATALQQLSSDIGNTSANLTNLSETVATNEQATATSLQQLFAGLGDVAVTQEQFSEAMVALDGRVSSTWGVRTQTDQNGQKVISGIQLAVDGVPGAAQQADFRVSVDNFVVTTPAIAGQRNPDAVFAIDTATGTVVLNTALASNIILKNTIESDGFVGTGNLAQRKGWQIKRDGTFQIYGNPTGANDGKTVIDQYGMRVYSISGNRATLRVRIGDLTKTD